MADFIGGDLNVMTGLKTDFDRHAGTVDSLVSELDAAVNNVIGSGWQGPAAERFREAWQSQYKKALLGLREALGAAAQEIQRRRDSILQAGG
jgi:WXG100 family type VII secretion target